MRFRCKTFCTEDKQNIINLKDYFANGSVEEIRDLLQNLDHDCQHGHYSKHSHVDYTSTEGNGGEISLTNDFKDKELKGHPLQCCFGFCNSQLRLLQAGAVHYPALRMLQNKMYQARNSSDMIRKIEYDLTNNCLWSLMQNLQLNDLSDLVDEVSLPTSTESKTSCTLSTTEAHLEVEFAGIIEDFYGKLNEDPEFTCCSHECLLLRTTLTHYNFTAEKFSSSTWLQLKRYLLEKDTNVVKKTLYACNYCRKILNANSMPGWCVLNGLYAEPILEELTNLNTLESQFIQHAKCFQTVVRLGTYTGKVPTYLQFPEGCKGNNVLLASTSAKHAR